MNIFKYLSKLLTTIVALSICVFFILGIGISIEAVGFNYNIVLLTMLIFAIPTITSFLLFLCSILVKPRIRKQISSEQIIYKRKVYPLYLKVSNDLSTALRNKTLTRIEILELKELVNKSLGTNLKRYKEMSFKNDIHEIRTKLKSHHISLKDMETLQEYLSPYSIPIKNKKQKLKANNSYLRVIKGNK